MKSLSTAAGQRRHLGRRLLPAKVVLALLAAVTAGHFVTATAAVEPAMMDRLRSRVANRPADPVAWRLLGKALLAEGQPSAAEKALRRAAELDPSRAAVHFDLAHAQVELEQYDLARQSLLRVIELAPETAFARDAEETLGNLAAQTGPFRLASFQPRWVESAAAEPSEIRLQESPAPFAWRIETGVLFNSNVDLAPISRQLSPDENGGFQGFFEPEFEYALAATENLRLGLQFAGFFAFNEPDNSDFDLQHYEPGIYVEFPWCFGDCRVVPQLSYDFSYDLFGGQTLGTRHELAASLSAYDAAENSWTLFFASDVTDFRDDGDDPSITSLDGPTQTIGVARKWQLSRAWVDSVRLSADGQWAELAGADQAYRGAFVLLSTTCVLSDCWELRPELGWGFRAYPDFVDTPSRDESIWRGGVELRRWLTDNCYLSANGSYDLFDSANEQYAAERFTAGASATFLH